MPTASSLHIDIFESDHNVIVRLKGDAGVSTCDELDRGLLKLTAKKPPLVVFDLQELIFISSLGLGILLRFQQGLARSQGRVRYAGAQKQIRDVLKKSLLDRVMPHFESLSEAIDAKDSPVIGQ